MIPNIRTNFCPNCEAQASIIDAQAEVMAVLRAENAKLRKAGIIEGLEMAAKALQDDAKLCDCFAYEESECSCGAWCEWKSITSARAVEIVRAALQETER